MTKENDQGLLARMGTAGMNSAKFLDDIFGKLANLPARALAAMYKEANPSEKLLYNEYLGKQSVSYTREVYQHLTANKWRTKPR